MRRSSSVRLATTAAAASAVLLLGACGGDSEDGSEGGGEAQQSEGASSGGGEDAGSGGSDGEDAGAEGELEGTWTTGLESPYNILFFTGETATFMNDSGEEVCTGPAVGGTLALVCQSGNTEFTAATISQEGDTLNVSWEAGSPETYQRLDDAAMDQLPTDLPTDMLDMPGLEDLEDLEGITN
ncbi:hypothetical protein [Streptomyces sp. 6N223]|uniref:hypothetical protein n=1 Tax=Streptomyces sp. 6N223 TaxID=3457412 RepID=UPI003FD35B04